MALRYAFSLSGALVGDGEITEVGVEAVDAKADQQQSVEVALAAHETQRMLGIG